MKVQVVSKCTEAKIKAACFATYIVFIHFLAFAGAAFIFHELFGPF